MLAGALLIPATVIESISFFLPHLTVDIYAVYKEFYGFSRYMYVQANKKKKLFSYNHRGLTMIVMHQLGVH